MQVVGYNNDSTKTEGTSSARVSCWPEVLCVVPLSQYILCLVG
jgi:hypothetical protein